MFGVLKADHVFLSCLSPDHCDRHVVQLIRLKEGSECSSANPFHEDSAASQTPKVQSKEYMQRAYFTNRNNKHIFKRLMWLYTRDD